MAEGMYGPILLMAAFFGAVVLLMTMLTPILWASIDAGQATTPSKIDEVFAQEIAWDQWEPNTYTVTDASQSNGVYYQNDACVEFDAAGGSEHPLYCTLVRNATWPVDVETSDYWVFWQHYGVLGFEVARNYVSLDAINSGWDSTTNYSVLMLELRYTFKVIFWVDNFTATEEFRDRLDNNLYNVSAGANSTDTMYDLSPWTMLGKIMTFRMPGTNLVTNALIAIPIYTALLYIAFAIIRSIIPTLGG